MRQKTTFGKSQWHEEQNAHKRKHCSFGETTKMEQSGWLGVTGKTE